MQYFYNPHHIPNYHPDDFTRDSVNKRYADSMKEKERHTSYLTSKDKDIIDALKEKREALVIKTPPLPPKRYRQQRENSVLWQSLKDAGVILSDSKTNPFQTDEDGKEDSASRIRNEETRGNSNKWSSTNPFLNDISIEADLRSTQVKDDLDKLADSTTSATAENGKTVNNFKSTLDVVLLNPNKGNLFSTNLEEFDMGFEEPVEKVTINLNDSLSKYYESGNTSMPKSNSMNDITASNSRDISTLSLVDLDYLESRERKRNSRLHSNSFTPPLSPKIPTRSPKPMRNRFSCLPVVDSEANDKIEHSIYFGDGLFQKSEERNEEAAAFFNHITKIRKLYRYNDIETNPGFIKSPVVSNNALSKCCKDVCVYFGCRDGEPKTINCNLSCNSNDLILKLLKQSNSRFEELEYFHHQYVFQVAGFLTYLELEIRLCDFIYIQECVKHDKNIELVLIESKIINVDLGRDEIDDGEVSNNIVFEQYFEIPTSISVAENGLKMLLDTYNKEVSKLMEAVSRDLHAQYQPDRLIQVVKAITMALATIELIQIEEAIKILVSLKGFVDKDRSYINLKGKLDYNEYINPMRFDHGKFQFALQKLTTGVYSLIELYCKSFQTGFKLHEIYRSKSELIDVYERIDPTTLSDNFVVRLSSIHRIPAKWKFVYEHYTMQTSIYYGGQLLCPVRTSTPVPSTIGLFEHIKIRQLLEFDIEVKKLPREAKICFSLHGHLINKKSSDIPTLLGWFTTNVYDYEGFLVTGSKLYGLVTNTEFNPVATCATNYIQHHETVILKIDFQLYHTEVLFPQPILAGFSVVERNAKFSAKDSKILEKVLKKPANEITEEEKDSIWKNRFDLTKFQNSLIYLLVSVPSWDSENITKVHAIINAWPALSAHEALEFLQADYPNKMLRETAVKWLENLSDDELCDYLPELVQGLKYEAYHNSALARFLITRALKCPNIGHLLFWSLKYYIHDIQFCQRFQIILNGFLNICGNRFRDELAKQDRLMVSLSKTARNVQSLKDSVRKFILKTDLERLNASLFMDSTIRVPINPDFSAFSVSVDQSSYFNSNAVPLKIVMNNSEAPCQPLNFIYKIGDDLRKDLITILLFRAMNKLWINKGLDLKMMTYNVLPTGPMTGLIELVPNSATFREIHVRHGVTGSFKDNSLALWLQRFNSNEEDYKIAIDNFTASAAGYCVATYLLGIGDRHNDNIMLTRNGHLFHIDFNKFLGDVQKFGNISRDRVPFVLTPDMAYVINNGITTTPNFQKFIEYCCSAFNIIRHNMNLILNLLGLMVYSGISYLSHKEDILYVREALQVHLTDEEATVYFTRLIESSLSSKSTQLNFFIHNLAHMKNITESVLKSSNSSPLFSFSNKVYRKEEEINLRSAHVVDFQKRYLPEKHYVFVINVMRENEKEPKFVFRRFEDFQELNGKLNYLFNIYDGVILPDLPPKVIFGRSQVREVTKRRRYELEQYLTELSKINAVWNSDIIYTFLHSYIKDIEEERNFADYLEILEDPVKSRVGGKIKLSMVFKDNAFKILIMHVTKLVPRRLQALCDPYVKVYLLPDPIKYTKRKTKIIYKTLNPTFNETITYDVAIELLTRRVLQISVWDHDHITSNIFLGGINFYLSTLDLRKQRTDWFTLEDIGLGK